MRISFKEQRVIEVQTFSDEEYSLVSDAIYSAVGNKEMSQQYIDRLKALLSLTDDTEARLIQHRLLLLKAYGSIKAFEDQEGLMPQDTPEFSELKSVGEDIAGVLGI